jgi:hypothetical protein
MHDEGGQGMRPDGHGDLVVAVSRADDVAGGRFARDKVATGPVDGDRADVGGERSQVGDGEVRGEGAHEAAGTIGAMSLSRIAWLTTVAVAALTGVIVLLNGYTGYGILTFVVGASAAINLR